MAGLSLNKLDGGLHLLLICPCLSGGPYLDGRISMSIESTSIPLLP